MSDRVEIFLTELGGEQQKIMFFLNQMLMSYPGIISSIKYKIPFYSRIKWICYLNPIKNDAVSLCFTRGNELSNENGLLESKGRKLIRSIDFSSVDDIPVDAITDIIKEALFLDETVPYHPRNP